MGSNATFKAIKGAFVALAGIATIAASPVMANSSAAAVDVSDAANRAQESSLNSGDTRFRQLFASWEALDAPETEGTVQPAISIPSRNPLSNSYRLSSGYGMRNHPVLGRRKAHKGIDLAAPTGTPVYATADGIVTKAKWFSSYGLYISIDHSADLETRYAHLSKLAVEAGEFVKKGDLIGYVGSTGRSTGPHLHYEVRIDGVAVDPLPFMAESEARFALSDSSESADLEQDGQGGE
ncbi:M23 family metallopeptidase [Altererythrobacter sp. GH1-8]|uniref:M23 family metallopeptidase n=1 Tax=Altererythrobacter sp. GH1-8 TaxID=3349333 RepID=UPI00374D4389